MSAEITANELRRYAIRTRTEITYRVRGQAQECVVNHQGIIKIPGISGRPAYNSEDVLARADEFELRGDNEAPRTLSREQMLELLKPPAAPPAPAAKKQKA